MEIENIPYLTVDEVAGILRIHKATATRWIKEHKLPAMKIGRRWLVAQKDFDELRSQEAK